MAPLDFYEPSLGKSFSDRFPSTFLLIFHTMTLSLLPLVEEEFDTMISHATLYPLGDDFTAPPVPLCWSVKTRQDAEARLIFDMSRQRQRYLNDASVRFMKVIDTNDGSIVSIAPWHYYPLGYLYDRDVHWELIPRGLAQERAAARHEASRPCLGVS